jgi:RNA polymerase primary sigma factor|tara:strand:- start:56 stop:856 length:801 start_codon:yes stop_codon:yes gene_type:complete
MAKTNIFINQEEIKHYLKDVRKSTILTKEREKELAKIMMSGNATEEQISSIHKEMLEGNLRFVISVAKDYQNQGIDLADLIAEGNFGLLKAIENFDWSKGFRFISYAVWWVKQSILQCLNENARTIRLPANIIQELYKAKKEAKNGIVQLNKKLSTLPSVTNLSKPINEDGDTLIDVLVNEAADAPDSQFNNQDTMKQELIDTMSVLDDREMTIVRDYFGLVGTPKTLAEIGEEFNLTKERVRQIKEKALRKLRNDSEGLLDYMSR